MFRASYLLGGVFCLVAVPSLLSADAVDFNRDVRRILSNNCYQCHGPDENKRQASLRLDTRRGATTESDGGIAIVPRKPDESLLVHRILASDEDERMPPVESGKKLTTAEKKLLTLQKTPWIKIHRTSATVCMSSSPASARVCHT